MFPARHVRLAAVQVLAPATLTKVESIFHEEAMTISGAMTTMSLATGTRNSPAISSIWTVVPEEHPCVTTTLKHLQSHKSPPSTDISSGHTTAPTVQAIVVNRVSVVNPQLAPIIGDNLEVVVTCPEDSQAACPAYSEVVAPSEAMPPASCVPIIYILLWALKTTS